MRDIFTLRKILLDLVDPSRVEDRVKEHNKKRHETWGLYFRNNADSVTDSYYITMP